MNRSSGSLSLAFALLLCGTLQARADDPPPPNPAPSDHGRITLLEENDSLYFHSDKHYTQGLDFSYLTPTVSPGSAWNGPFHLFNDFLPIFNDGPASTRRYSIELGQSLFTPQNIQANPPDPRDRPYAGWAYAGVRLLQENQGRDLESFEIQLGVVGPGALGKETQNDFHALIGANPARGWSNQIQNEPGLVLSYDRSLRVPLLGDTDGIDIVPEAGVTLGNVFTYGEIGALLRVGKNLKANYGPVRVRPGLSGTDYFNPAAMDGKLGYYVFAGLQGRAVAHDIFLDGNTFRQSPHVNKEPLVGDMEAGVSFFWSDAWKLDFMALRRTIEFSGQPHPDLLGTAAVSFSW